LGTLKWVFGKNDLENLGMECYSIDGFKKNEFKNKVGMFIPELEAGVFRK
jgi:hypothetical protein